MTGSGMRPLDLPCSEQGKQPTAKAFKLAERDTTMSEQEKQESSFMQELDRWTEATIINALAEADEIELAAEDIKRAIRTKVLESYRNGQGVKPGITNRPSSGLRPVPKRTVPFKK